MEAFDKETIKCRLSLSAEDAALWYVPFVEGEDGRAATIATVLDDPLASYQQIFDTVWTSDTWTEDDYAACRRYALSSETPSLNRLTLISAVGVALLDTYDELKLAFLCDMLDGIRADENVRAALFLFLFVIGHPDALRHSVLLGQRLTQYLTNAEILTVFTFLQLNVIAVQQSLKKSVNYEKEIIRRAAQSLSDVKEIGDVSGDNVEAMLEENPELKKACEDIFSLVHNVAKLRFRGVDVGYRSFAKVSADLPFFNEPSNWFCPFSFDHPELFNISELARFMAVVADSQPCDTDRFTLLLSLPEGNAEVKIVKTDAKTLENENLEGDAVEDFMHAFMEHHASMHRIEQRPLEELPRFLLYRKVSSCVIDTFRFYQIYGTEAGLCNPFSAQLYGWRCPGLAPFYSGPASKEAIANWLQEFGQYDEAAALYVAVLRMLINGEEKPKADEASLDTSFIAEFLEDDDDEDIEVEDTDAEDAERTAYAALQPDAAADASTGSAESDAPASEPPEAPAVRMLRRKAEVCHNLGICHDNLGNIRASQVYLRLSLRYVPDNLKVVRTLADSYRSNGRWSDALPLLEQLYAALPPYSPASPLTTEQETEEWRLTRQLATVLMHLERYEEALPLLVKADYKHPAHLPTLRALAWTYLVCNEPERAEQKYRAILATGQGTSSDYYNAAHCALIADNVDLAVERYKESLRLQHTTTVAADFLAGDMPFLVLHGVDPVIIEYIPDLINSL